MRWFVGTWHRRDCPFWRVGPTRQLPKRSGARAGPDCDSPTGRKKNCPQPFLRHPGARLFRERLAPVGFGTIVRIVRGTCCYHEGQGNVEANEDG